MERTNGSKRDTSKSKATESAAPAATVAPHLKRKAGPARAVASPEPRPKPAQARVAALSSSASTGTSEAEGTATTEVSEWINRRATAQATRAANARQVSGRRRFVDPTTCERDYSLAEMEFMQAMHDYKQRSGRMFPTWSEVLEVLKSLGYEKDPCLIGAELGAGLHAVQSA